MQAAEAEHRLLERNLAVAHRHKVLKQAARKMARLPLGKVKPQARQGAAVRLII